jgi:hypothetical protein
LSTKSLDEYFSIKRMSPEGLKHQENILMDTIAISSHNDMINSRNKNLVRGFERWLRKDGNDLGVDPIKEVSVEAVNGEDLGPRATIVPRSEADQAKAEAIDSSPLSSILPSIDPEVLETLEANAETLGFGKDSPEFELYVKAFARPVRKVSNLPKATDPKSEHVLQVISRVLTTETDKVLDVTPPLEAGKEVDPEALPTEIKMLLRTDYAPSLSAEKVEKFEEYVIAGGLAASESAASLTGVTFDGGVGTIVDASKLSSFVKDVEANANSVIEKADKAAQPTEEQAKYTGSDSMYSFPNHVAHLADLCRLSGEATPKFDAEFTKVRMDRYQSI